MSETLVTFENVASAASAIHALGETPTVRSIQARLGGGSPNGITPLLKRWRESRPLVPPPLIVLDPRIHQEIANQIALASAQSAAAAQARAEQAEADNLLIAAAGQAAERLATKLQGELDAASDRIQQQRGQLGERAAEFEKMLSSTAAAVNAAEAKADHERKLAEEVRQELVRATLRVEAVPRLDAEIATLAAQLRAADAAVAQSQQAEAVAVSRSESAAIRADESVARERTASEHVARLEKDLHEQRQLERALREASHTLEKELGSALSRLAVLGAVVPVTHGHSSLVALKNPAPSAIDIEVA